MTRRAFEKIADGLKDAIAVAEGDKRSGVVHVPQTVDVRAIRESEGLTQEAFATRYGFSVATVRDWEQGRRQPERPARILLRIIEREPETVRRILKAG